jgi:hypothetical protein
MFGFSEDILTGDSSARRSMTPGRSHPPRTVLGPRIKKGQLCGITTAFFSITENPVAKRDVLTKTTQENLMNFGVMPLSFDPSYLVCSMDRVDQSSWGRALF